MFALLSPDRNIEVDLHALQSSISLGNESAFGRLYGSFYKRLCVFSFSLVHSREIAEDVVEEVFISVWMQRTKILEIRNLSVYLYVAVKNRSLNKISDKARQLLNTPFDGIEPEVEALEENPYTALVTAEMLDRMNKAIEALPPRCKMIFKLVREDGLRYKEVAEILNISVNTIDVQMAIAIKRLCLALGVSAKPVSHHFKMLSRKKS